jgi:hypothetical protein
VIGHQMLARRRRQRAQKWDGQLHVAANSRSGGCVWHGFMAP